MSASEKLELESKPFKRGKVKDVYELGDDQLVFVFTDRVSAYDIVLPSMIPRKGEVLCKLAAYWFDYLKVPNHMVRLVDERRMAVRRLKMIPVECVVRGYLYGSLYERLTKGEVHMPIERVLAAKLPEPIFDPTTKVEGKEEAIKAEEVVEEGMVEKEQMDALRDQSLEIYRKLNERAE